MCKLQVSCHKVVASVVAVGRYKPCQWSTVRYDEAWQVVITDPPWFSSMFDVSKLSLNNLIYGCWYDLMLRMDEKLIESWPIYGAIASCVCVGYLLTFLILYGSRAAMLPGSWIWGGWLTYLVLVPLRPIMTIILHPSLTSHQPDLHTTGGFSSLSKGVSTLWQNFMVFVLCATLFALKTLCYSTRPVPYNLCVGNQISHLLTVYFCQFSIVS